MSRAKEYHNIATEHEVNYANLIQKDSLKKFHDFLVLINNIKIKAIGLNAAEKSGELEKVNEQCVYLDHLINSMRNMIVPYLPKSSKDLISPSDVLAMKIVNTKIGLNGYLAPTGEFFECEYGRHAEFAIFMYAHACSNGLKRLRNIEETHEQFIDRMGYISMGSKGPGFEVFSHLRIEGRKLTEEQIIYFDANNTKLDENQSVYYNDYMVKLTDERR